MYRTMNRTNHSKNLHDTAYQTYLQSVKTLCPATTEDELAFLNSGLSITQLEAKHFYIHAQSLQSQIGYVYRGLLRSFYVDAEEKDITVNFISEGRFVTHYSALISGKPSRYHFQCLEPSVIVNLSYSHIQKGYSLFSHLDRYGRLVAEEVLKAQQARIESFLFHSAEDRYKQFIHDHPSLFQRVSVSHLCSYLGIERQSLTRIRKKLMHLSV